MSTTTTGREQPFECNVCHSRFTRHENLKRHSDLHNRAKGDTSLVCRLCRVTFSRRDLLDRHVKRKHPDQEEGRPAKVARRDTLTSIGYSRKRSDPKDGCVRQPSRSPVEEQEHLLPQLWDAGAYLDLEHTSWDMDATFELSTLDDISGPAQADAEVADLLAIADTGGSNANVADNRHGYSLQRPHSSSNTFEDAAFDAPMPPDVSSMQYNHHVPNPTAGRAGTSTPSPGSSSDGAIPYAGLSEGLSPRDLPYIRSEWRPSEAQVARGLDIYFSRVSLFIPFLHRPTVDSTCLPLHLTLSILAIAYQYEDDPVNLAQAESGQQLSLYCFHKARVLSAAEEEIEGDLWHNLALVQSLLLLEICAMMYICGKTSTQGMKMHSRMVSIARSSGLLRTAPPATAKTKDLESMWRETMKAESHKRTILAAHQIDALWYQFLSVPRFLSHLEVKHELPCPEDSWSACSAADWAHRRLVAPQGQQTQYTEAVRLFLSRSSEVDSMPPFDPYGAINIAQFLLSSAREVSGWSTMTGQVSLERFEPLRASLVALAPFICSDNQSTMQSTSATCAATWEMAMIELNIWSPSHTCGIVESSLDAAISQSTYLAVSGKLSLSSDVVASIQPHLDWFLRYLGTSPTDGLEAPWLSLYAYKAFLVVWQLVGAGVPGAMHAVGVADGDANGAVAWLRGILSKRKSCRLGELIIECLDLLEK
jgi:hypothetical protein